MNRTLFGIKRVYWSAWKVARAIIKKCRLTPARYDLMRIIAQHPLGVPQEKLHWLLGVTRATTSRMLKALEGLGLVDRVADDYDRRRKLVTATALGKACTARANEIVIECYEGDRTVARGVLGFRKPRNRDEYDTEMLIFRATEHVATLDATLDKMRKAYCDGAPFPHPWNPHDIISSEHVTMVNGRIFVDDGLMPEIRAIFLAAPPPPGHVPRDADRWS